MGEILEELHRLQIVELKLVAIRQAREERERRLERYHRRVRDADERLTRNESTVRTEQMRIDELSLDVAAREEAIGKHRQALTKAKTNKEYAAILAAMNTKKADNAKIENEILRLMEQAQAFKDEGTQINAEKAQHLEDVRKAEAHLKALDDERGDERSELESVRAEHAAKIAPPTLATFTRVASRHDGAALAEIQKVHPKRDDYVCSGCNITVTLEVVNALQTRDEIQLCGACGRIFYLESSTAGSAKP